MLTHSTNYQQNAIFADTYEVDVVSLYKSNSNPIHTNE